MSIEKEKQKCLYKSRVCEQAEMYKDMVEAVDERAKLPEELNDEERNLLSVAYKNLAGTWRTAYRVLCGVDHKNHDDDDKFSVNRALKEKIARKLDSVCLKADTLLAEYLIPNSVQKENKVFMLKMRADYCRYRCETASAEDKASLAQTAKKYYEEAQELAAGLPPANPIRLGLALNFSVFYYEIEENSQKACTLAKMAFDLAISELEDQAEDSPTITTKDSTLIMQLLRDNLTLWNAEIANTDEPENLNN